MCQNTEVWAFVLSLLRRPHQAVVDPKSPYNLVADLLRGRYVLLFGTGTS